MTDTPTHPTAEEIAKEAAEQVAHMGNQCCHRSDGFEEDLAKDAEAIILSAARRIAAQMVRETGAVEALAGCASERKELIEGIVHAENEVTEFRNKHFDEDPGDDGQPGSPEYETLRGIETHLSGCCIDNEGEYMPRDKYDAALAKLKALTEQP